MSFTRANAGGWAVGDKLTSAQANALDIDHANALDKTGDTVAGTINLGTGTLALNSTGTITVGATGAINANASGAVIKATASGALIQTLTGGRIQHGDNDYPTLAGGHTGRTRVLAQLWGTNCVPFVSDTTGAQEAIWTVNTSVGQAVTNQPYVRGGVLTTTVVSTSGAPYTYGCRIAKLVNGATLSTVVLNFIPATTHSAVPTGTNLPEMTVYQTNCTTNASATLISAGGGLVYSSFAGTVGTWNSNAVQSITYTTTQNNVIDTSTYDYLVIFGDECGANAKVGTTIVSLVMTYTNILDLRSMP